MVFRQPAVIAQDLAAPVAGDQHSFQLAPAVTADFEVGLTVILVRPGAMVVFRHEMGKAEDLPAPRARKREFPKDLPANVATVHYA